MSNNGNGTMGHGYYFEDLAVGMEASYAKKITNEDVLAFADLSGDTNPVHLNDAFAAGTIFKKRIAHGFLTGALFSTVLGTKLPGPGCIYLSQSLKFRAPVHIGDPAAIGIRDIHKPDAGDAVDIRDGEVPVFWACGVTPQAVAMEARPPFLITHKPGHMFLTDLRDTELRE